MKRWKNKRRLLTLRMFLAAAYLSCCFCQSVARADTSACRMTCIIPDKSGMGYWATIEQAITRRAKELGVEMAVINPSGDNAVGTISLNDAIDIAMLTDTQAIILSYNDTDEITDEKLKEAREMGIRIVFIDRDADRQLRDIYVGIDNEEAGYHLGCMARDSLAEGELAMLVTVPDYLERENFRDRLQGISQAFADCPERLAETTLITNSDPERILELHGVLQEITNVKAMIFCSERMTLIGSQVYKRIGDTSLRLYGFDLSEKTMETLENGEIEAILYQNNETMGTASVNCALALVEGKPLTDEDGIIAYEILRSAD